MENDTTQLEKSWKWNVFWIWMSQLLGMIGFASALPFIPIYMRVRFGIEDPGLRGWYVSMFYFLGMASFAISQPIWGTLSDKFGRKVMLLRANFLAGLLFPAMMLPESVWGLIGVRFVCSMFSGAVNSAQTLAVSVTPVKHHGVVLGSLSSAIWSGNMIGFLGGSVIVYHYGYQAAFIFCGAMYLAGFFMILFFVRENFVPPPPKPKKKFQFHLPDFPVTIWMTLGLFCVMAFARRFDESYLALQVENIAGKVNTELYTGWISAAAAAGGVIAGLMIGHLMDRFSAMCVAVTSVLMSIVLVLTQGFATNLWVLGIARFGAFVAASGLEPVFLTVLSRNTPDGQRGQVFGWSALFRTLGMAIAAPLGGGVIYFLGVRSVYVAAAVAFLLLLPYLYGMQKLFRSASADGKQGIR